MRRALVAEVERRAGDAWPAESERRVGGWVLRTAGGFSRRLNSVQATNRVDEFERCLEVADEHY